VPYPLAAPSKRPSARRLPAIARPQHPKSRKTNPARTGGARYPRVETGPASKGWRNSTGGTARDIQTCGGDFIVPVARRVWRKPRIVTAPPPFTKDGREVGRVEREGEFACPDLDINSQGGPNTTRPALAVKIPPPAGPRTRLPRRWPEIKSTGRAVQRDLLNRRTRTLKRNRRTYRLSTRRGTVKLNITTSQHSSLQRLLCSRS